MDQLEGGEKAEVIMEFKAHKLEHQRLSQKLAELNGQLDAVYRTNQRLRQMSLSADPTANSCAAPTTRFETPQKQY